MGFRRFAVYASLSECVCEGQDHLFLVNEAGVKYMNCADQPPVDFEQFLEDVRDRAEMAMSHEHILEVCRLSIGAQAKAQNITAKKY